MSHGSADELDATSQQDVTMERMPTYAATSSASISITSWKPTHNLQAIFPSSVPSMTDYKPLQLVGRQISDSVVSTDMSHIMEASDPADALLMDLHKMDPLEDFSFAFPTGNSRRTSSRNVTVEVIEKEDETLHAMEEDEVLSEMLHHVLEDSIGTTTES
jgi:hypothetical protein